MTDYDRKYFNWQVPGASRSAVTLLPYVKNIVQPESVLDVGCGNGAWLGAWRKLGVKDILGVDGAYINKSELLFPANKFMGHDLTTPLNIQRKFDLVMSLEVAEHLEEEFAQQFVESLVTHGEVIFFSAALPGQGGTHHVNERWPSYWSHLFAKYGYKAYDVLRPRVWNMQNIEVWYRQNCIIFATDEAARRLKLKTANAPLDMVHPELFTFHLNRLEAEKSAMAQNPQVADVSFKQFLKSTSFGPMLVAMNAKLKQLQERLRIPVD